MSNLRDQWEAFVDTIEQRMMVVDPDGLAHLDILWLRSNPPENQEGFDRAVACVSFNHSGVELINVFRKQSQFEMAALVAQALLQLISDLAALSKCVRVPKEFVKEVCF